MTQQRVGWRAYVASTISSLLTSLYGAWNGDTLGTSLDSSIYGAWNGDNNANDSVSTNHGTLMNGCTFTTGKIGQAFTFDGVNDYLELPSNTMNFTSDFTISFWAYMRTRDTNVIISNIGNDGINRGFYIDSDGSYALRFVANYLAPYYSLIKTDNNALFDLNVWNHYTFICKNGVGQWYKNGVANGASGTVMTNGYITNNKPIIGGYRSGNAGTISNNKNMALDSITTWTKAISQDELTQLYNLGTGTQYPFSTQTLPSASNQLGVDNGTLMNGCTFTDGKIGKAFTFDEVNDYVSLPNNSLNFNDDFSVSFWVYTNISFRVQFLFNSYSTGNTYGYGYYCYMDNGKMTLNFVNGGTHESSYQIPYNWTQNWHHVVVTRKRSTSTNVYINGSLVSGTFTFGNVTKNPVYQANQICNLGGINNGTTNLLNGKMDAFSTWSKVLSDAEVTELYNSGNGKQITTTPIVTNGLVLNLDASRTSSYPNTGTTWTDISGSGNNGTLTNGPIFGTANDGQITFDGINDYVVTSDTPFRFSNKFTISIWFYWDGLDKTNKVILGKRSGPGGNYAQYAMGINNGDLQYGGTGKVLFFYARVDGSVGGNDPLDVSMTYTLPSTSGIYNVSVTMDSNIQKLYINGVLVTSSAKNLVGKTYNISGREFLIGANRDDAGTGALAHFNGKIYSVYVYGRTLTDSEILQNFNATKSRFGL